MTTRSSSAGTDTCLGDFRRQPNPTGGALDCLIDEAAAQEACSLVERSSCAELEEFRARQRDTGLKETLTKADRPDQFGPCGPIGPGNQPVFDCEYQSSVGVNLQGVVDSARRTLHTLGLRAYRVFLVWVRRDSRQRFNEFKRIELMPVKVSPLDDVSYELMSYGLTEVGGIQLSEVSPTQVNELDLRGFADGRPLRDDEEFFYEVRRIARCEGESPAVRRFTVASLPHFDASGFEWSVALTSQDHARTQEGEDRTFKPADGLPRSKIAVLRR